MRVFLDTNILLDLLLERPGYEYPAEILQMHDDRKITVCQSSLSLANIAFVLRKEFGKHLIQPTIKMLCAITEIIPLDEAEIQEATLLDGPDFEDIMQLVCAVHGNCDILVTRNIKDFKISSSLLPGFKKPAICTPESFLLEFGEEH